MDVSPVTTAAADVTLPPALTCAADRACPGAVKHIYVTSVGDGPRVLTQAQSLADAHGMPLSTLAEKGVSKAL